MRSLLPVFALGLILFVVTGLPVASDQLGSATPLPLVAEDPARCRAGPRSVEALRALARTPGTPDARDTSDAIDLDQSAPVDAATLASIAAMLREFGACGNGGDWLRLLALTSDDFIRTELNVPDLLSDPIGPLPTAEWLAFVEVRDARLLSDGRVVAVAIVANPAAPEEASPAVLIFVRIDGRWLIDADLDPDERRDLDLELEATPAAVATAAA